MKEITAEAVLGALEAFFASESPAYRSWTLESKRKLRVLSTGEQPWPNHTTHIAFDAFRVKWPGVRPHARVIPVVPVLDASDPDGSDGSFHAAWLLDWAISKNVAPAPGDVVLSLGHAGGSLPHIRFEYAFPWETDAPAEIRVDGHLLVPVIAYSISDAEAQFQHARGSKALTEHFDQEGVQLFDRGRADSM